ncbi:MAG: chemotaxis protein CheX [Candidatus Hydrogenedentes bacterium]|nr:chemotaxis protein CheX [Candidatus Hydrogenedentota bacterium]
MTKSRPDTIADSFIRIVEGVAFMLPERDGADLSCRGQAIVATMPFKGPVSGSMALAAPEALAVEIAANMLGTESNAQITPGKAHDAFGELLSVIGGNLLAALFGNVPVFDCAIPEIAPMTTADWEKLGTDPCALLFNVEECPVLLRFQCNA